MDQEKRDSIKNIVYKIRNSEIENKEEHFSTRYEKFKKDYPNLFRLACDSTFDLKNLDFMMQMLEQMNENKLDQNDASISVGQLLFKQYVEPKVELMKKKDKI